MSRFCSSSLRFDWGPARLRGRAILNDCSMPAVYKSIDIVSAPDLTVSEYFGREASKDERLSACLVSVVSACEEACQTPDFDEHILVTP